MTTMYVSKITKRFGGLCAVDNVSFDLKDSTILGLIGPNGAGKSTLFNCISGFENFDEGTVSVNGKQIKSGDIKGFIAAGISRTFQEPAIFDEMTVLENIRTALSAPRSSRYFESLLGPIKKEMRPEYYEAEAHLILGRYGLEHLANKECATLGAGQRRVVEVVRAVASNPQILLLDEPAAGLNPTETQNLKRIISRIRDLGISIIIVEHDLRLIMDISDEIVVLNQGKKIAQGPPYIIQKDKDVIAAYLGKLKERE